MASLISKIYLHKNIDFYADIWYIICIEKWIFEEEEIRVIIFIVGDPHRGKSVMEHKLRHLLPLTETMRIAAQVDGEGDWTQTLYRSETDLVAQLRKKGEFSPNFVNWAKQAVSSCSSRFGLADLGGKIPSLENEEIINAAKRPAGMIILAASFEEADKWVRLGQRLGLRIVAVLISSLESVSEWHHFVTDKPWDFEGLVVGLDRSNKLLNSATLQALAGHLLDTVPATKKELSMDFFNRLTIEAIAKIIQKEPEERKLPDREPQLGLNWRPEELPKVSDSLLPFAATGENWLIDGRAPQFLVTCVVHALHPCTVALADTKVDAGFVTIGERKDPEGLGSGPLSWHVTRDFQGGTLVEYSRDQFTIVGVEELPEIIPPEVDLAKPVFLSGKTSNWAAAEIAMTYAHHQAGVVYLFQPGTGFICVITHSKKHNLGRVIKVNPPAPEKK